MKRLMLIGIFIASLTACFNPSQGDEATLAINLGGGNGRAAIPWPPDGNILKDINYVITLSGNGDTRTIEAHGENTITITNIAAGRWNIKVEAYYQNGPYATGENNVDVKAGYNMVMVQMYKAFIEYNKFIINGVTYGMSEEEDDENMMFYSGDRSSNQTYVSVELFLEEDVRINIDFYVPAGNDKLVEGTYNLSEDETSFTYGQYSGIYYPPEDIEWFPITGGTMKISVSGMDDDTIYIIDIDCVLESEGDDGIITGNVKGVYRGTLGWKDFSY